ncbi:hypothetical protein ScPMuIL_010885 [Solemya velum]
MLGYCGVQTSPPNEHVIVTSPPRPWWEIYQPVSYLLTSRFGTEAQLRDMVRRCNAVGVGVYADLVINHMAGMGRTGTGTAGTHFDSDAYDFHAVPFSRPNFHNDCPVNNYGDPNNVRNCYLVGLSDLDQSQEYVRDKIAGYLNNLIDIGIKGFRVDAAKHMHPNDIAAIQGKLKSVDGGTPFFYHEVIDQNDGAIKTTEYTRLGYVTEFRYCQKLKQRPRTSIDFCVNQRGRLVWKRMETQWPERLKRIGTNKGDKVAFSRGNKGFFAMSKQGNMDEWLNTGLPAGSYCNLITDCADRITVDGNGRAHIVIRSNEDPVLAFIVGGSSPTGTTHAQGTSGTTSGQVSPSGGSGTTSVTPSGAWRRTAILIQRKHNPARCVHSGGLDHTHKIGCTQSVDSSMCAIPIRYRNIGSSSHYGKYNSWSRGDNFLDWYGAESGQGTYQGAVPMEVQRSGQQMEKETPQFIKQVGISLRLLDVDMDCSRTKNGWFEVKAL